MGEYVVVKGYYYPYLYLSKKINMVCKLKNTTSKQEWTFSVEDTKKYGRAYNFYITFTEVMPEGEYEFSLLDNGKTVWTGLAQIGSVVRVGENQKTHENNIEFKQYEG